MEKINISLIKTMTIPEKISNTLRHKILTGTLKGGTPLKQDALAQSFNVSISALREALKILGNEDLVEFLPNRGASVTTLSSQKAQEIYQIRIFLETGALELSIPQMNENILAKAEKYLQEEKNCTDPAYYNEINSLFHECLYEPSDNDKLLDMIRVLHNNVARYLIFYLDQMNYREFSHQEHVDLLMACREKNITKAKRILKKHIQSAWKQFDKYIKTHHAL